MSEIAAVELQPHHERGTPRRPLTEHEQLLVESHIGLVSQVMRRMTKGPLRYYEDDMVSDGYIGLCHAAQRFDPSHGVSFGVYAAPRVRGAILDGIRSLNKLRRGSDETARSGVVSLLNDTSAISLDADVELGGSLHDTLQDTGDAIEDVVIDSLELEALYAAIRRLPPRKRFIASQVMKGVTLREIGEELGVTESRICQIYKDIKTTLINTVDDPKPIYPERVSLVFAYGKLTSQLAAQRKILATLEKYEDAWPLQVDETKNSIEHLSHRVLFARRALAASGVFSQPG